MSDTWTLEDAKNDFTAIAEAAYSGRPQYVKNNSCPDLVIAAGNEAEDKERQELEENRSFVEFLMSGPKGDIFPDGYTPSNIIPRETEF